MADPYFPILFNLYVLATGFAVGGFFATSFALLTGRPLNFEMSTNLPITAMIIGTIFRILAGPYMIARNTLRAILVAGREPYWVMMAIVLASVWSYCQGVIIIETVCRLGACS